MSQGHSKWFNGSDFDWTIIIFSQGKNKILFYKKQLERKSTRVIFVLVQFVILRYSKKKHMMRLAAHTPKTFNGA